MGENSLEFEDIVDVSQGVVRIVTPEQIRATELADRVLEQRDSANKALPGDPVIGFGMHKGKAYHQIDSHYLRWLIVTQLGVRDAALVKELAERELKCRTKRRAHR